MTKSSDPPSKIIDRVIGLAKQLETTKDKGRLSGAEIPDRAAREKALRKYLFQQSSRDIYVVLLVACLGAREFPPEEMQVFKSCGRALHLRPDQMIAEMLEEPQLAKNLERGLAILAEHGSDIDAV